MCVTLSLADEEQRTTDIDNHTVDHQSDALVRNKIYFQLKKVADIPVGHTQDVTVDDNDDPNFDPTAPVLEDESPYPEVRSAVANTDDPAMPSSTFRAWVLGLIWAVLLPGVNQFFFFRYPSVIVDQVCVLTVFQSPF
jgi:hypothetical protein